MTAFFINAQPKSKLSFDAAVIKLSLNLSSHFLKSFKTSLRCTYILAFNGSLQVTIANDPLKFVAIRCIPLSINFSSGS